MEIQKKRIEYFDIAKGIGIFLVVWAHARGPFSSHIYQFHMPLFFLVSGLLYSERTLLKDYIIKKIYSLYIPFVFWNVLFVVGKTFIRNGSMRAAAKQSVKICLTLSKDGEFLGATWFLGALFVVSILYKVIDCLLKDSAVKQWLILSFFMVLVIIGFRINLPYMLSRTCILSGYFAIGVWIKKNKEQISKWDSLGTALVSAIVFVVIGYNNYANMGANDYGHTFLFFVGGLLASYALIFLCREIEKCEMIIVKAIKKLFVYFGKKSIDIVIWQFVVFRVVILIQIIIAGEPITMGNLLSYYPVYSTENGWWIVYTIVGMILPVMWCELLRSGPWGKILKRIHIV